MMIKFIILHILVSVYVRGQNSEPPPPTDMVSDFWTGDDWISAEYCCEMKVVGGKKYKLVGSSYDAYDYGCTSDCTYMTEGSDVKYCFRPGKFESECTDEGYGSRPPMTGPTGTRPPRPPMTTGGRPPMTTGGEPPMTTGGEPPMTTGGEPPMTTGEPGTGSPGGSSVAYSQVWLKGDPEGPTAHVHEGVRLADKSGWVAIGELLPGENQTPEVFKAMIRAVDNDAATKWTQTIGDENQNAANSSYSVGFSVIAGGSALYAGLGLWQKSSSLMAPAVVSLDPATGNVLWTTVLGQGQAGHGGVRSCIMDNTDIVCAGYVREGSAGFKFVADAGAPAVWRLDTSGNLLSEKILSVEGMGQVAKIRKDATSGFVLCSTGNGNIGGSEVNTVVVVKISDTLEVEWSQAYGNSEGESQVFDMLVDNDGNYLLGGHTTVGDGVVNWDYLALKVNSQTKAEMWRKTYGQPRGFDARYIHDEMYGVALDNAGNYLLMGGSGDEYPYSAEGTGQWSGWASDTWGSYLVVVSPAGDKLYENFYGTTGGNNAGEWLSYDKETGDIMVYTDSDTAYGFGFLKLSPA